MYKRIAKFVLGLFLLLSGGLSLMYIMNDSVAGYAAGHPYRNQEFIGTGALLGFGALLIYLSFSKKPVNKEDNED